METIQIFCLQKVWTGSLLEVWEFFLYKKVQAGSLQGVGHLSLLGDSGRVVNSLDFCRASLKSLGCFYFWCVLSSQWKAVTVNFTLPTLKAFLEARSQNVSGKKQ